MVWKQIAPPDAAAKPPQSDASRCISASPHVAHNSPGKHQGTPSQIPTSVNEPSLTFPIGQIADVCSSRVNDTLCIEWNFMLNHLAGRYATLTHRRLRHERYLPLAPPDGNVDRPEGRRLRGEPLQVPECVCRLAVQPQHY